MNNSEFVCLCALYVAAEYIPRGQRAKKYENVSFCIAFIRPYKFQGENRTVSKLVA